MQAPDDPGPGTQTRFLKMFFVRRETVACFVNFSFREQSTNPLAPPPVNLTYRPRNRSDKGIGSWGPRAVPCSVGGVGGKV